LDKEKKIYSTPELIVYGDLTDITQAGQSGGWLDASFEAGTPIGGVTLSGPPPSQ
jgi:hypothetical protein